MITASRAGPGRNDIHRYARQFFYPPDKVLRRRGQVRKGGLARGGLAPARHAFIDRLALAVTVHDERRSLQPFAVKAIAGTDLDLFQPVQYVELGNAQPRQGIGEYGAAQGHGIEPAAAPRPPRGSAEFDAHARQVTAHVVEQLGWKRSRADPGRIGLDDSEHAVDRRRTHTRTRGRSAHGGIGRSDERIRPQVDIQHGALGALEENASLRSLHLLKQSGHVADQRLDPFGQREKLVQFPLQGRRRQTVVPFQKEIVQIEEFRIQPVAQPFRAEEVRKTDGTPRRLVFVRRTDTPPGGTGWRRRRAAFSRA